MTPEYAREMARYNRWMNDKLYAVAEKLTDAERKQDRGAFFGSIHRTLNHLLLADRVWLGAFHRRGASGGGDGTGGIRSLDQELYADFDELRRERAKTDDEIDAFVATLTDGEAHREPALPSARRRERVPALARRRPRSSTIRRTIAAR